jgi:hypothetical protein
MPRVTRGGGADAAEDGAGRQQFRQHFAPERQHLPLPVPGVGPAPALVVEGNVADLAGDRIGEAAGEAPVEVAREQQVFVGARPERRLLLRDPVGFGFAREVADGVAHAHRAQRHFPPPGQARVGVAAALVEPDDGGAQRLAMGIEVDHGGALGGDHQAADGRLGYAGVGPQALAGLAQRAPELLGIVFHPARLGRLVAVDLDLGLVDQVAAAGRRSGHARFACRCRWRAGSPAHRGAMAIRCARSPCRQRRLLGPFQRRDDGLVLFAEALDGEAQAVADLR